MRRIVMLLALVAACGAGLHACSSGAEGPGSENAIPKLSEDKIWVTSVPLGLEVFSAESPEEITSEANFKGTTPVVFDHSAGDRFIAVSTSDSTRKIHDLVDIGPPLAGSPADPLALPILGLRWHPEGSRLEGSYLLYEIQNLPDNTLISLWQWEYAGGLPGTGLQELNPEQFVGLYPEEKGFEFDEVLVSQILAEEHGVTPSDVSLAVELLGRGGKVGVRGSSGFTVVELESDTFRVSVISMDQKGFSR